MSISENPLKRETVGDTLKGVSLGDSQIIGTTGTLSHEGECILLHADELEAGFCIGLRGKEG